MSDRKLGRTELIDIGLNQNLLIFIQSLPGTTYCYVYGGVEPPDCVNADLTLRQQLTFLPIAGLKTHQFPAA
jgi:hypothetical protein